MKQTLLQMTQSILSDLTSDEVNSIADTTESLQVANIIRQTYFNMMARYDLPEHDQLFQLDSSTDPLKPVLMTVPDGINKIKWIKYFDTNPMDGATQQTSQFGSYRHDLNLDLQPNAGGWATTSSTSNSIALGAKTFTVAAGLLINTGDIAYATPLPPTTQVQMKGTVTSYSGTTLVLNITSILGSGTYTSWSVSQSNPLLFGPGYLDVQVISLESFLKMTNTFSPNDLNTESFRLTIVGVGSGLPTTYAFYFRNDRQPKYCCILQNFYVIFDSLDRTQDSILQSTKTMCDGWIVPSFSLVDGFTPQLDDKQFPLLFNEAKSLAFLELKQQPHSKAEQEVQRQVSALQKYKNESSKPTDFDQLPNYGRRGHGWI